MQKLLHKLKNYFAQSQSQTKKQNTLQSITVEDDINILEKKVYFKEGNDIYIGGVLLTQQNRDLLREQAKYIETSQLWEVINSTCKNESFNLLLKAGNMEHVQYAKALKYWADVTKKIINELKK